jgi:phage baseplate assembly protein W
VVKTVSEKRELGKDLKLQFDELEIELGVDLAAAKGDFEIISDEQNLVQAIVHRLTTEEGELYDIGHADYGSRLHELVGEPNNARTREMLMNLVKECLAEEPRILDVTDIKVTPNQHDLNRLDIEITVLPVGKNTLLNVVYPFSLEGR